jgi:hypothetical protein
MSLPHVRFTVRRLMVAVAIVAGCLPLWAAWAERDARRMEYAFLALDHAMRESAYATGNAGCFATACDINPRKAAHHGALALKYVRAARYPFLPVWPDPPEPE